jgi:hypothetical protein
MLAKRYATQIPNGIKKSRVKNASFSVSVNACVSIVIAVESLSGICKL